MPLIISFVTIKGGDRKTTTTILVANNLAAGGYRVCVIDFDINNSSSFYYLLGVELNNSQNKNIAKALYDDGKIDNNIIKTKKDNVSLIASSLHLADLRAIETKRLVKKLKESEFIKSFDFVIIDTPPTYDNIVLNAINSSDLIITPVNFNQFSINTTKFLEYKLMEEMPEKLNSWYILYNGFVEQSAKFDTSIQSQLMSVYQNNFKNILDVKFPQSSAARRYIDTNQLLRRSRKDTYKLWLAVNQLAQLITNNENYCVEVF